MELGPKHASAESCRRIQQPTSLGQSSDITNEANKHLLRSADITSSHDIVCGIRRELRRRECPRTAAAVARRLGRTEDQVYHVWSDIHSQVAPKLRALLVRRPPLSTLEWAVPDLLLPEPLPLLYVYIPNRLRLRQRSEFVQCGLPRALIASCHTQQSGPGTPRPPGPPGPPGQAVRRRWREAALAYSRGGAAGAPLPLALQRPRPALETDARPRRRNPLVLHYAILRRFPHLAVPRPRWRHLAAAGRTHATTSAYGPAPGQPRRPPVSSTACAVANNDSAPQGETTENFDDDLCNNNGNEATNLTVIGNKIQNVDDDLVSEGNIMKNIDNVTQEAKTIKSDGCNGVMKDESLDGSVDNLAVDGKSINQFDDHFTIEENNLDNESKNNETVVENGVVKDENIQTIKFFKDEVTNRIAQSESIQPNLLKIVRDTLTLDDFPEYKPDIGELGKDADDCNCDHNNTVEIISSTGYIATVNDCYSTVNVKEEIIDADAPSPVSNVIDAIQELHGTIEATILYESDDNDEACISFDELILNEANVPENAQKDRSDGTNGCINTDIGINVAKKGNKCYVEINLNNDNQTNTEGDSLCTDNVAMDSNLEYYLYYDAKEAIQIEEFIKNENEDSGIDLNGLDNLQKDLDSDIDIKFDYTKIRKVYSRRTTKSTNVEDSQILSLVTTEVREDERNINTNDSERQNLLDQAEPQGNSNTNSACTDTTAPLLTNLSKTEDQRMAAFLDVYLREVVDPCVQERGTCDSAERGVKRVALLDIDEVRRNNSQVRTAEITPMPQPQPEDTATVDHEEKLLSHIITTKRGGRHKPLRATTQAAARTDTACDEITKNFETSPSLDRSSPGIPAAPRASPELEWSAASPELEWSAPAIPAAAWAAARGSALCVLCCGGGGGVGGGGGGGWVLAGGFLLLSAQQPPPPPPRCTLWALRPRARLLLQYSMEDDDPALKGRKTNVESSGDASSKPAKMTNSSNEDDVANVDKVAKVANVRVAEYLRTADANVPRRLYKKDGVYQLLSYNPIIYAKLLVALEDAHSCRALLVRGASVALYCLRTGELYPLHAERVSADSNRSRSRLAGGAGAAAARAQLMRALRDLPH